MAKKATTIILIIVVIFLLASTVYVSIILTSDTGTTAKQAKASEINPALQQASDTAQLAATPVVYANPSPTGESGVTTSSDSAKIPAEATPVASGEANTSNLPETGLGQPTIVASASATPSVTVTMEPTSTLAPTIMAASTESGMKSTPIPVPPTSLPVAGGMEVTLAAVVVAGFIIVFAFLF